jgi:hypothetical protein
MKTPKSKSALLGVALTLALASLMAAIPAVAAPLNATGYAIVVHAQDITTGQVLVNSVTAAQDGWLLIWKDSNGAPGSLLGYAPVHQGVNTNVAVDIKTTERNGNDDITPTLWASVAPDANADIPYATPDPSIMPAESVVMVGFGSEAAFASAPAMPSQLPATSGASSAATVPTANKITVHRQDAIIGQVMVDSVTATQDGWLLIWKDANGGLIGYAPVHQGVNTNVTVDIKTTNRNGEDDLPATLWATYMPDPNAMTPFAVPDPSTTPASSVLMVAFGSTAD